MSKRERIEPFAGTRYVRRVGSVRFKESDDVGRLLAQDRARGVGQASKPGQGDRGDL